MNADQYWAAIDTQRLRTTDLLSELTPGTALDAGCGAGAEAIWLAAAGWQVTAADISSQSLARAAERARRRPTSIGDRGEPRRKAARVPL